MLCPFQVPVVFHLLTSLSPLTPLRVSLSFLHSYLPSPNLVNLHAASSLCSSVGLSSPGSDTCHSLCPISFLLDLPSESDTLSWGLLCCSCEAVSIPWTSVLHSLTRPYAPSASQCLSFEPTNLHPRS